MAKEKRKTRGMDWDEVPPIQEGKKFDAGIETFNFNDNSHSQIRLIGKVYPVKMHWVPTIRKDGSRGQFPKLCLHNGDAEMCPYCKAGIRVSTRYFSNAIIRDLEESRPRKAKYDSDAEFKKPGDKNWTPVRAVAFPASVMQKIMNFKSLTKVKTKNGVETFHVSHPKYGRDLNVKLDPNGTGSGIYDVQREEVSKLEGEEKEYLTYDLETMYDAIETEEEALATLKSCFDRGTFEGAKDKSGTPLVNISAVQKMLGVSSKHEDDDEDDEDEDTPKKSRKSKSKKRSKEEDYEDEIEDDDDLDEDEEDDEEESSRSKKSKKSKSKKKSKRDEDEDDDDEDLDEDLEEDDEDEEEESSKSRKSKKSKSKKRSKDDDEDDEDEELEDDDEDEEEEESSKSRKSKKSKSKKRSKDEDDEDEDLDEDDEELEEDDEDEDDEPKSKKSRKSSKSRKSKKRSKDDDEDEDDDELEDDEDDEEEESSKSKKRSKSRKKSRR